MAGAVFSERRALTCLLCGLLAGALVLVYPVQASAQKDSQSESAGKQRKAKRVKALSLAAQNHIIKVTKILQKYSELGEEASALQKKAADAQRDLDVWQGELAATRMTDRDRSQLQASIAAAQKLIADTPKTYGEAGAEASALQKKAEMAQRDMEVWQGQLAASQMRGKAIEKLKASIAQAQKLIAETPAEVEKLQKAAIRQISRVIPVLDNMRESKKLQSQDKAAMWNYYGYSYAILERYEDARNAYESLLKEEEVADNLRLQALYSSGQLSMLLEQYALGIQRLEEWFNFSVELGKPIRAGDHFLLAQGYYALRRYDDVIDRIDRAIGLAAESSELPKERWLRLLVAVHFAREDFARAESPLEMLVLLYPKREYWLQLQGTYGQLEQRPKQLAVLDLAWRQGLLEKESEYISLAQHLQFASDALEAALVLEDGLEKEVVEETFENFKMLGGFWQRAQETDKALKWYRKADKLSDTGEIQYRMALLLNLENRTEEFLKAARAAYKKGGFANRDEARVLIGQALLELEQLEQAREVFQKIADAGMEDKVKSWLDYVDKQIKATDAIRSSIAQYRAQEAAILAGIRDDY